MTWTGGSITTGSSDAELDSRLSKELTAFNERITGDHSQQSLSVRATDGGGELAGSRGCTQVLVRSFTFQAPDFYRRLGYREFARSEGLPTAGHADVHFRKDLTNGDGQRDSQPG